MDELFGASVETTEVVEVGTHHSHSGNDQGEEHAVVVFEKEDAVKEDAPVSGDVEKGPPNDDSRDVYKGPPAIDSGDDIGHPTIFQGTIKVRQNSSGDTNGPPKARDQNFAQKSGDNNNNGHSIDTGDTSNGLNQVSIVPDDS